MPAKIKKGRKIAKNLPDYGESASWQKVKIKGNVVSDDGGGLEGLIGLEVLENYDSCLVAKDKKGKKKKKTWKEKRDEKKLAKKRKPEKDGDSGITSDDDDDEVPAKKKKREIREKKQKERKEKREKRKQKKKASIDDYENEDSEEDEEDDDDEEEEVEVPSKKQGKEKKQKENPNQKKKKASMKDYEESEEEDDEDDEEEEELEEEEESDDDEEEVEQTGGSFVRRPATEEEDAEINQNLLDQLEGWNGLGVPDTILRALAEKGFKSPTQIQALSLPAAILGKKDILGAAETGSGKTLAFGIPILSGIMELKRKNLTCGIRKAPKIAQTEKNRGNRDLTPPPEELESFPELPTDNEESEEEEEEDDKAEYKPLYAVILTPTRELAVQVRDHIIAAAKYTGITVVAVFGGMAAVKQERLLNKCPEIVVATPGRFWELLQTENPHLCKIDDISFLVIDETDRMVEKGHFEELKLLLRRLNADETRKQKRQNFVFSATLALVHDLPEHLQKRNVGRKNKVVKQTPGMKIQGLIEELGISQPKIVDITSSNQTAHTLTESRLICQIDQKDYYLYYFVQRHPGRTIVFSNSIDCVKRLATLFGLLNCNPLPLHANMIQKQRLKNLEKFTTDPNGFLIATDVAARGLDIPNVQHVIHYQVPRTSENYVHRSGRTARANQDGITVMFMDPGEVRTYLKLCKTLDRTEDLPLFPVSERHLNVVRERVDLARDVDKLELRVKRAQNEIGWMKKNAEEMEMIIDGYDDDDQSSDDDNALTMERSRNKQVLTNKRLQLASALSKTIFPRGYSMKYPTSTGKLVIPQMQAEGASKQNTAVKAMKEAIEDLKEAKKQRNKKRK